MKIARDWKVRGYWLKELSKSQSIAIKSLLDKPIRAREIFVSDKVLREMGEEKVAELSKIL